MIETGFGKEFSEPPSVSVSDTRTHCEACKEPLDPSVMHKCHGNQEYQTPVSHTEITEACRCGGNGVLHKIKRSGITAYYVVVCEKCRTFFYPEVATRASAMHGWNVGAASGVAGPKWIAALPGDDERANVIRSELQAARHPDLTAYKGACPAVHVDGEACDLCEGTGIVPPTKPESEGAQ